MAAHDGKLRALFAIFLGAGAIAYVSESQWLPAILLALAAGVLALPVASLAVFRFPSRSGSRGIVAGLLFVAAVTSSKQDHPSGISENQKEQVASSGFGLTADAFVARFTSQMIQRGLGSICFTRLQTVDTGEHIEFFDECSNGVGISGRAYKSNGNIYNLVVFQHPRSFAKDFADILPILSVISTILDGGGPSGMTEQRWRGFIDEAVAQDDERYTRQLPRIGEDAFLHRKVAGIPYDLIYSRDGVGLLVATNVAGHRDAKASEPVPVR